MIYVSIENIIRSVFYLASGPSKYPSLLGWDLLPLLTLIGTYVFLKSTRTLSIINLTIQIDQTQFLQIYKVRMG